MRVVVYYLTYYSDRRSTEVGCGGAFWHSSIWRVCGRWTWVGRQAELVGVIGAASNVIFPSIVAWNVRSFCFRLPTIAKDCERNANDDRDGHKADYGDDVFEP